MPALSSLLKNAIAVLGLLAVFLAALEHEDLILQQEAQPLADCAGTASDHDSVQGARVAPLPADSGTEGTFRSNFHMHWLPPREFLVCTSGWRIVGNASGLARPGSGRDHRLRLAAIGARLLRP